jgi:shikimate dehydrogenase
MLFREKHVGAAYTIASVESFSEIARAISDGTLRGVSVTAPFKEEAMGFAAAQGAEIAPNAEESGAVNTIVNVRGTLMADNTDVDGFLDLLSRVCGRDMKSVAIIGAGGTARAALIACRRLGLHTSIFNRTPGRLGALPLADLDRWDGEILIDTTSADLDLPFRPGMTYLRASYGAPSFAVERARDAGAEVFGGMDLLEAQAIRQNELFVKAMG